MTMPLTTRRAVGIGKKRAYVNTAGRVVSSTKMAIHTAGRVYSHFVNSINIHNVIIQFNFISGQP